nr:MAG TPA: hypothetical protein [Caudoviricetes sp.]
MSYSFTQVNYNKNFSNCQEKILLTLRKILISLFCTKEIYRNWIF